ncbi:hypothetical protein ABN763_00855 [Spongiivirga sp. MCCC 1A20706]|uniref:hypothetical protein n=1 Tax=Spongiivirga sp. MCCC 1A20706 TaxID=3160963 RepID=UPI0039775E80
MSYNELINWLLLGDVSIQYQTHRDLLSVNKTDLQKRIAIEGWGAHFIQKQNANGYWGQGFYQPKWISSHYTLLDIRNLCIAPDTEIICRSIQRILEEHKANDGGIYPISGKSDVCVNGMFLSYACYFRMPALQFHTIIDMLLSEVMKDGGFNCRSNRSGAKHSSLHSTISVLEGLTEYEKNDHDYRINEVKKVITDAKEFILLHKLFKSDRTGDIINNDFLRLSYPSRWRYDILRALDYFQYSKTKWDNRMQPAIDVLLQKRNKNGTWNLQAKHPGKIHFELEKAGKPSRLNTLRALRVLNHFDFLPD